jgi:Sulfotransferase domain
MHISVFALGFVQRAIISRIKAFDKKLAPHLGLLPNFVIIGAQKCGTTSLYNYLVGHPAIYEATTKEVGYFDQFYDKGLGWYRSHFPTPIRKFYEKLRNKTHIISGEASTGYILYPHALRKLAKTIPDVKLILMLRNPVDRAYSHYNHSVRCGKETLPFEEAIEKEEERVGAALRKIQMDEDYYNEQIDYFAYLRAGIYIDQIKVLMDLFPAERVLILKSEDFYANSQAVFNQTLKFLDVPSMDLIDAKKYNSGVYSKMNNEVRNKLEDFFRPYNQSLYEYLGNRSIVPW